MSKKRPHMHKNWELEICGENGYYFHGKWESNKTDRKPLTLIPVQTAT